MIPVNSACRAAHDNSPAGAFCSSQGVVTLGQPDYAYFSEQSNKYVEIDQKGSGTSKSVYLKSYRRIFGSGEKPPIVITLGDGSGSGGAGGSGGKGDPKLPKGPVKPK